MSPARLLATGELRSDAELAAVVDVLCLAMDVRNYDWLEGSAGGATICADEGTSTPVRARCSPLAAPAREAVLPSAGEEHRSRRGTPTHSAH